MSGKTEAIVPRAFIFRRLHSLLGLWLVIYLVEHLLVNSQAALWIGDDGAGFVRLVNLIQGIPYLQVVEIILLGVPIAVHGVWGVKYLLTSKANSRSGDGSRPALPEYGRNRAYTWQRISSWVLLVGIILHVAQMRFWDEPIKVMRNNQRGYAVKLNFDEGLYTLAARLGVLLLNQQEIAVLQQQITKDKEASFFDSGSSASQSVPYDPQRDALKSSAMADEEEARWILALGKMRLKDTQVVAVAKSPGAAILLTTRDTFKNPIMGIFYTVFVLAAGFHAFNGLWIFLNTWGAILSLRSQKSIVNVCWMAMAVLVFFGLAAIWGSYWINLRN